MRGILFERGKWLSVSRAKITDTRLELRLLKLDVATIGIRFVSVKFVDKGFAEEIRRICSTWAVESQLFNPQPVVGHLAQEILKTIYRAQLVSEPFEKSPGPPASP